MTNKEVKTIETKAAELRNKINSDHNAYVKYSFLVSLLNNLGYELELSTVYRNGVAVLGPEN